MRRAALWIGLGLGLVLAQRESVVHSPDGSLAPLTFGSMTCLRVVQGERALSGTICVDLGSGGGSGVLRLPLSEGSLEVPYRVDPALGEVSYLIRLGAAWRWSPPAPTVTAQPATPAGDPPVKEAASAAPPPVVAPSVAPPPQGDPPATAPSEAASATPPVAAEQPAQASGARPQEQSPAPVNKTSPAAPVWSYFSLRKTPGGWQLIYSLLARSPLDTPTSGIRLFLDGKPLAGKLTRRTTASTPGRLEAGQSEYGWIDLGPLEGSHLRLIWSLGGVRLEREWRLP